MCLEVLTTSQQKHEKALSLIERWRGEIVALKAGATGEELAAYESLERELLFRRTESIRSQVRRAVVEALSRTGASDAEAAGKEALEQYDKRSALVHDGTLPDSELADAVTKCRSIVQRVLEAYLSLPAALGRE